MENQEVATYFNQLIRKYGATPKGADWNGEESQELRFRVLLEVIDTSKRITVNDFGCSYGALCHYIDKKTKLKMSKYYGYDISREALKAFQPLKGRTNRGVVTLIVSDRIIEAADYSFCSGVFNGKLGEKRNRWEKFILDSIRDMDKMSYRGYAFNCLRDKVDYMENHLYYSAPGKYIEFCRSLRDRNEVKLLENYGIHDWTILVKKN